MTIDEKKEYLKSYQKLKREIVSLEDEKRELRTNRMFPSVNNDGMPKASGTTDLSGYAADLDRLDRLIQAKTWGLINLQHSIELSIQAVEDATERSLLRHKYLCGKTWEQVCVIMDYEWAQIHRIHARALRNFDKMI